MKKMDMITAINGSVPRSRLKLKLDIGDVQDKAPHKTHGNCT